MATQRSFALLPFGTASSRWLERQGLAPADEEVWIERWLSRAEAADKSLDGAHFALEVARWAPLAHRRGVAVLVAVALEALDRGATLVPPDELEARVTELGDVDAAEAAMAVVRAPSLGGDAVSTDPARPAPLLLSEGLQLERSRWLEARLAGAVAHRVTASSDARITASTDAQLRPRQGPKGRPEAGAEPGAHPAGLSAEQQAAVEVALAGPLAVITGGPGTGKTRVAAAVVSALAQLGIPPVEVALAAPTGKAAHRLGGSVRRFLPPGLSCPRVETLHRLLGARPGQARFSHNRENPVPMRALLVDEASMLDLELAVRLLDALEPDARLVLLGDADQLPSVDAGAVLRDMVETLPASAVARLTHSFRMDEADPDGRAVLDLARAVNQGSEATVRSVLRGARVRFEPVGSETERARFFARHLDEGPLGDPDLRRIGRRMFRLEDGQFSVEDGNDVARLLAGLGRTQLLTVTRRWPSPHGAEAVNQHVHALYAEREGFWEEARFLPGEPILMLRNDHNRRLYNGDTGVVITALEGRSARPMAVFAGENAPMAIDLAALAPDLSLAHAITVHKAQGSEYEAVSLLLPDEDSPLCTRELLYTAVTRARSAVTIAGDPRRLAAGLDRRSGRASGLRDRLAEAWR